MCQFNKWRLALEYERRFDRVCKHMNGELSGPAKLRMENCSGCEKQRTEKCPDRELSIFPNNLPKRKTPKSCRT